PHNGLHATVSPLVATIAPPPRSVLRPGRSRAPVPTLIDLEVDDPIETGGIHRTNAYRVTVAAASYVHEVETVSMMHTKERGSFGGIDLAHRPV
ncbi:hypothetical protein, partial [Halorubrum sp. Hd13]|uniref:hypothetical protein n=1 Tax=Halorubrum sp. Hd13 TaxID=1480728 RepID=UPI001BAF8416